MCKILISNLNLNLTFSILYYSDTKVVLKHWSLGLYLSDIYIYNSFYYTNKLYYDDLKMVDGTQCRPLRKQIMWMMHDTYSVLKMHDGTVVQNNG